MEELEKQELEMMLKIVIELGIQYPIVQLPHTHRRFISIIMDTICQNSKSVKLLILSLIQDLTQK